MGAQSLFAQAGNDNPGGVTNDYNGSSTVAGRYDPYTGNASRAIDDIVVTGGIGAYPHKLTRTLSTRGGRGGNQFGEGGGWTHNYSSGLTIFPSNENDGEDGWYSGQPAGQITYPGGAHFDLPYSDGPPWRISGANGRLGCDDILADLGSGYYELRQCDGGKVLFEPAPTPTSYQAYAIIDPFGQTTTLAYDANGRLWKVTEPGGRYLEFFYQTFSYWTQTNPPMLASEDVILMVQANDGRGNVMETVTYEYESVWISSGGLSAKMYNLKTVRYDDLSQASYTYAPANTNWTGNSVSHETAWIVQTCDDPRYAGPMKQIQYEYVQRSEASPDFVGRGQLKAEKNLYGQIVSRTTFPTSINDPARLQRTETRGDGRTRSFNYPITASPTEFSFTWTDFQNHTSGYMGASIIDPRGNATTYEREPVLGAVRKVIRPPTYPGENATVEFAYTDPSNPYFHSGEKDENDHWTYYDRDDHNRVWQIRYPDGSTEEFTYNNFGQVVTHKLRSGGTETFTYDTRGLKQTSYPPATESDPDPWNHPTRYYYYQSGPNTDRLQVVTDPRGNST
ncbi:MAG TPA: RHS repeat domain-containing protein, partial [Chthoniobacterales bacterium]|nr:RHS repeat domain-containing protein [Chthoniobacterales bacterium]